MSYYRTSSYYGTAQHPGASPGGNGISVTELNGIIAGAIKSDARLRDITVTAEISGFKNHLATGHWYFTLKDGESAIGCVMFRQNNLRGAARLPRDGEQVTVRGYVDFFGRDGRVQLYAMELRPAGIGGLWEQFEALKRKLAAEGLFDSGRKRVLPMVPGKVAVVTSASGAALHDILNVSAGRCPSIPIVVVPTLVQGPEAGSEIARAIDIAGKIPGVEVVIVARGGGSVEDLWCFNDEAVARAVTACSVPVVSGVGHETDISICDLAADVRASTPSNAAEIVFPDRRELKQRVSLVRSEIGRAMVATINRQELAVRDIQKRLAALSPERQVLLLSDRSHQSRQRLRQAMGMAIEGKDNRLQMERMRLAHGVSVRLGLAASELQGATQRLRAVSPLGVLDRGFALIYNDSGGMITQASQANKERVLLLRFSDGQVTTERKGQESHE